MLNAIRNISSPLSVVVGFLEFSTKEVVWVRSEMGTGTKRKNPLLENVMVSVLGTMEGGRGLESLMSARPTEKPESVLSM